MSSRWDTIEARDQESIESHIPIDLDMFQFRLSKPESSNSALEVVFHTNGSLTLFVLSYFSLENPLMGWTSTGDPYAHVGDSALSFDGKESAMAFAEEHGWHYLV
ncbi:hypothetical protein KSP40_PGU003584 [Platanthera guangdongensis]|uniref:NADH dehydrogenase [ubiquinone] iron-sulfur protein 4, mitochondrial n=1 Tax=Platanthera guangdongensis TaxID=2320717 RepID=A0ABR2N2J9_9ASPA